jgi:head-tail adaptor
MNSQAAIAIPPRKMNGHAPEAYNQRVLIEVNKPTTDAAGQQVQNWETRLCARWAMIVSRGGGEGRYFVQLNAQVSHLVRMQASLITRTISPAQHRVRWLNTLAGSVPGQADKILNIESVADIMNVHNEIELRCTEVQT